MIWACKEPITIGALIVFAVIMAFVGGAIFASRTDWWRR